MSDQDRYETVIGLEIHARLLTRSKLFCGDSTAYGAEANTHISPVTLAHPGTLPKMNRMAVELAVRLGLACHSAIEKANFFARKNYFYPDLPKGYQISQHTAPICRGGFIPVGQPGREKKIRLNRIHLEEDAGRSLHDLYDDYSALDFNRAGTSLVEIVTEPEINSGDEAAAFLAELRRLVRYLDVCDGNMEEGSLRCDANISVRLKGEKKLGTKAEIKNLNSIRNVKRAIEYEAGRMVDRLQKGEKILQQTLSFDATTGTTFPLRDKEEADDYRYFPEPDLAPFSLDDRFIEEIRKSLHELPAERKNRYMTEFGLSEYDSGLLSEDRDFSDYFEELGGYSIEKKSAANWMLGPVKTWINEQHADIGHFPINPGRLAKLIRMVETDKLSFSVASSTIFPLLLGEQETSPELLAEELNLIQESDLNYILPIAEAVLLQFKEKVSEYQRGKKGLLGLFVGEVIKRSKGKADPKIVNEIILEKLKQ